MVEDDGWPPIGAPLNVPRDYQQQHWTSFDTSVNAVSFGFVATAILISMFLLMAIFERFLRPTSPPSSSTQRTHSPTAKQCKHSLFTPVPSQCQKLLTFFIPFPLLSALFFPSTFPV
ncbi:hypothetical protein RJT34_13625 [Clitoria ternatea]|uniref:Uncharacterized protein n=1 Tax=Clitoria ternatea TaxID=43366 RepID=A0AAN9JR02_CLITE